MQLDGNTCFKKDISNMPCALSQTTSVAQSTSTTKAVPDINTARCHAPFLFYQKAQTFSLMETTSYKKEVLKWPCALFPATLELQSFCFQTNVSRPFLLFIY
jgi:hypothetical protein